MKKNEKKRKTEVIRDKKIREDEITVKKPLALLIMVKTWKREHEMIK